MEENELDVSCISRGTSECIVFISSVGSISIVSSELKKETFVFFSSNRRCQIKHRLVAVK